MANFFIGATSGQTLYAEVLNAAGQVYNTNTLAFETYNQSNWTVYAYNLLEQGNSGTYMLSAGVADGEYFLKVHVQAGGSPAVSDAIVFQGYHVLGAALTVGNVGATVWADTNAQAVIAALAKLTPLQIAAGTVGTYLSGIANTVNSFQVSIFQTNGLWEGNLVVLTGGPGAGQARVIKSASYMGSDTAFTVSPPFVMAPVGGSTTYAIYGLGGDSFAERDQYLALGLASVFNTAISGNTIDLSSVSGASSTDDAYKSGFIAFYGNLRNIPTSVRVITGYNGTTKIATLDHANIPLGSTVTNIRVFFAPVVADVTGIPTGVWAAGSRTLTGTPSVNMTQIAGDSTAATQLSKSASSIVSGTAISGTLSTTAMTTDLTEATNDHYKGRLIVWKSGTLLNQVAVVTGYNGATKKLSFDAITEAPQAGDTFILV